MIGRWILWNSFDMWLEATDTIPKPIIKRIIFRLSFIKSTIQIFRITRIKIKMEIKKND